MHIKTYIFVNLFIGFNSGFNNISGTTNIFIGYSSGYNNTTGSNNVYMGYQSAEHNNGTNKQYAIKRFNKLTLRKHKQYLRRLDG